LPCDTVPCWDSNLANVGNAPIVTTEFGGDLRGQSDPCPGAVAFDDGFMGWADQVGVSYAGFAWDVNYFDNPKPTCSYDLLDSYPGMPRYVMAKRSTIISSRWRRGRSGLRSRSQSLLASAGMPWCCRHTARSRGSAPPSPTRR
jgi:hypothetical protein